MFTKTIKLFTMFGFEVKVDLSWLVILVLVVWSLSAAVLPQQVPGLSSSTYLLMGLLGALGLFMSIVFHELCHSLVARLYGLQMKGITLFIFGGVAEMAEEPPSPKAEFMMAVAGPASSVVLGAAAVGVSILTARADWPVPVTGLLRWLGVINLYLAAFNMIPGFPLDGGRVLRSMLWQWKNNLRKATEIASKIGLFFGALLIVLGFLSIIMTHTLGGMWYILIGMFLRNAARQGYQGVIVKQALSGEKVRRFMTSDVVAVPRELTIKQLVDEYIYKYHFKMFPVMDGDMLAGCVSTRQVKDVPHSEWSEWTVGDVASECSTENVISPDEDAMKALVRMNATKTSRLMVVDGNRLVGVLSLKDLLRFLALKMELEGDEAGEAQ